MAINPSKLLRLKPIRATISASSLRGSSAPVKPKITASQISSSSITANKQVLEIQNSLSEIINILKAQNKFLKDTSEKTRKSEEAKRRAGVEENLEKRTGALSKATEKILSPVKSLLDKIIDFILAVFIGRSIVKLIRWFSDPQNKTKIKSLFRFLGDHWPKLLALYLRFGTGLGRFIGGLSSLLIRGTLRIAQAAAGLAARAGLKGAGKIASFLGGRYGKALAVGLEVGTTVAGTMALSKGIENFAGLDTNIPKFSGGGLAALSKLFKFSGGSYVPGYVSGEKGVDRVPAMLSDGEFVMSRGAVEKYGVNTLEAMNAAGGGTNKPKISNGKTYAAGGGLMSYATNMIQKHESLAALSPNTGGANRLPDLVFKDSDRYKKLTGNSKIYPYLDSKNVPTIGWGSTYYGSLLRKSKEVTMSDPPITKSKADSILNLHLSELVSRAKSLLPLWNKMTTAQQGTIVSFMYNSGANSINPNGEYPKFSKALIRGDMVEASKENKRDGPSKARQEEESKLLLSGPKDLTKVETPPPTKPQPQPGFLERIVTGVRSIFSPKPQPPQRQPKPQPRFSGGVAPNTTSRPSTPLIISASTAKSRNASKTLVSPPMNFVPEVVYEVAQSREKVANGASGVPRVPSFSVSYAGGNAEKNATIYGIG
jgi:GH24 family phage-related lysozyme (muramidase)